MMANFAALGLLSAVGVRRAAATQSITKPFRVPLRWLGGALAASGIVLLAVGRACRSSHADEFLVEAAAQRAGRRRPSLPVQPARARRRAARSRAARSSIAATFRWPPSPGSRHAAEQSTRGCACRFATRARIRRSAATRSGARAFHLLGDAKTRAELGRVEHLVRRARRGGRPARLRRSRDGRQNRGSRRTADGRAPPRLSRPDSAGAPPLGAGSSRTCKALLQPAARSSVDDRRAPSARRGRDRRARRDRGAESQRAAVVVLDADDRRGAGERELSLARPSATGDGRRPPDALLDRARYGLYPPGSTFKLVTAAAALRQDPELSAAVVHVLAAAGRSRRREDSRLGRPIRDDVLDRHPHGTIAMHDGLVRSCNAYFAQLAVRLGADALAKTASLAGISYPTTGPPERLRENLPHARLRPGRRARHAAAHGARGGGDQLGRHDSRALDRSKTTRRRRVDAVPVRADALAGSSPTTCATS